jgi:hypothetical protein
VEVQVLSWAPSLGRTVSAIIESVVDSSGSPPNHDNQTAMDSAQPSRLA